MAKTKRKVGRPTNYTLFLSDCICERLTNGESLRSISRDCGMPVMSTLFRWLKNKPEFKLKYDIAKGRL